MKNFVGLSVKKFLRPLLINFISVKKIQDYNDDFKSKKLLENGVKFKVTEVENENIDLLRETYLRRYEPRFEENVVWFNEYLELNGEPEYSPKQQNTEISRTFQKKLCALLQYEFSEPVPGGVIPHDNTVAVAISLNGRLVVNQAFSLQDRENVTPANEDMVSPIASITKTFTALMIMKLIEEEAEREERPPHKKRCSESDEESDSGNRRVPRITLDTYVEDILTPDVWPEHFVMDDTNGEKYKITIKQLLQHESGLKSNDVSVKNKHFGLPPDTYMNDNNGNLKNSVGQIKCKDLYFKPGEDFTYSNHGYQLLALVYEKRTGRSFVEDLRDELAKMGLYDTDFNYREHLALNRLRESITARYRKPICIDYSWAEASYGLVSTTGDLVKYGNIVANCYSNLETTNAYPLQSTNMLKAVNDVAGFASSGEVPDITEEDLQLEMDSRLALGWERNLRLPKEQSSLRDKYEEKVIFHDGSATGNLATLAIYSNNSGTTSSNAAIQDAPMLYPLGESYLYDRDILVGAITVDRTSNIDTDVLLLKIINLVLCEYRKLE